MDSYLKNPKPSFSANSSTIGGGEVSLMTLAEQLVKQGLDVRIVFPAAALCSLHARSWGFLPS